MKTTIVKVILPLLLLTFVLGACEEPEVGSVFILKRTALGGVNIDSMERAMNEMKAFEDIGELDMVEEYIDFSEISSFSVGTIVRVTETDKQQSMVQIKKVYPKTGNYPKMWIDQDELIMALR